MTAAGFGLKLHDLRHGTRHLDVFNTWWGWARGAYLGLDGDEAPTKYTFYYDPLLDLHHRLPIRVNGLYTAWWLASLVPGDAQTFFEAVVEDSGVRQPELSVRHPRIAAYTLFLAREFGDGELAALMAEYADERYEPTWDRATGEFTWGFGLNEEHPRGQYNAAMVAAEAASEGAWYQFGQRRLPDTPLVRGVDFPAVGLSEARWVDGVLNLQLSASTPAVLGSRTTFEVVGVTQPTEWHVAGPEDTVVSVTPAGALRIETTVQPTPIAVSRPG